jgi:hypothetical protein
MCPGQGRHATDQLPFFVFIKIKFKNWTDQLVFDNLSTNEKNF